MFRSVDRELRTPTWLNAKIILEMACPATKKPHLVGFFSGVNFRGAEINFGVRGVEPRLHAPHACVQPLYYTPSFNAFGAGLNFFSISQSHPLKIGIFSFLFRRVILTAKFIARRYES